MHKTWEFFSTQRIVFGEKSIHQLRTILNEMKAKHVFLITDPGIQKAGIADQVIEILKENQFKVTVFDEAVPEPPVEMALSCYEFAKSQKATDVIIGLGGGSSIDLAKVTALLMAYGGHPKDYFGEHKVPGPIAPLIAVPTTAGTGSEVTSVSVLADKENNLKVGISDNHLRPAVALLDPELTTGLPSYVTACSGIDALTHAVEAYTAKNHQYITAEEEKILFKGSLPISDVLAFQSIELIAGNLVKAVQQGSNLEARSNMLLASLLAGMAFSNAGTALAHALAYPIGGLVTSPHGEITGMMLPYVMEYNAIAVPNKMIKIAKAFDVKIDSLDKKDAALASSKAVMNLLEDIELPTQLSQIGIQESNISDIAEKTLSITRLVRNNPRVPTQHGLESLIQKAL